MLVQFVEANGARIPALGLGTWDLDNAAEIVEQALRLGYRHIDTAEMYGIETDVGEGLRASGVARGEVFITTRCGPITSRRPRWSARRQGEPCPDEAR